MSANDDRRERDRVEARERAQADLIAVWISHLPTKSKGFERDGRLFAVHLAMRNASHVPVYDVAVSFHDGWKDLGEQSYGYLSPTGEDPHRRELQLEQVKEFIAMQDQESVQQLRASVRFRDAAGVSWYRSPTGALSRLE